MGCAVNCRGDGVYLDNPPQIQYNGTIISKRKCRCSHAVFSFPSLLAGQNFLRRSVRYQSAVVFHARSAWLGMRYGGGTDASGVPAPVSCGRSVCTVGTFPGGTGEGGLPGAAGYGRQTVFPGASQIWDERVFPCLLPEPVFPAFPDALYGMVAECTGDSCAA